jgi:superfamily II DNA/RNA helicase
MPSFNPSRFINTNPVEMAPEVFTPVNSFETFGLTEKLVANIKALGITIPSPIQDQVIPEILNGNDVIGLAETGTGKTAAFLVPLIEKTLAEKNRQTLILAPTRELALQIENELHKLARGFSLFSVVCVGGVNIQPQIKSLRYKNHFVIGTPGRIKDLIERRCFNPAGVTTVILDEADRMLDMGFIHDIRTILGMTPDDRETLFFSATMAEDAKRLVHEFLRNPVAISVKKKDVANSIEQDVVLFSEDTKFETLASLLRKPELKRVLIFCSMKHGAEKLANTLHREGIRAESIHGNKSHSQRQRALNDFKAGKVQVLVATNVAARGIHVDDVSHVINFDLPQTFEDYVHRIGRTGRGENRGKALTFVPMYR